MKFRTKVRKSIRRIWLRSAFASASASASTSVSSRHSGDEDSESASQAFSDHASEAMTISAQFATNLLSGPLSELTPLLSCAIRFSWLQRSFAWKTTCSAVRSGSLVT